MIGFKLVLPETRIQSARPNEIIVSNLYANMKIALNQNPPHIGILKVDVVSGPAYTFGSVTTWFSFPHGYDYAPAVVGVQSTSLDSIADGGMLPYVVGALGEVFMDADEKNVNVKFRSEDPFSASLPTLHFYIRYYVFAEPGLDP